MFCYISVVLAEVHNTSDFEMILYLSPTIHRPFHHQSFALPLFRGLHLRSRFHRQPVVDIRCSRTSIVTDASMAVKMTVQFNLFGGTVLKLGTERHHKMLIEV